MTIEVLANDCTAAASQGITYNNVNDQLILNQNIAAGYEATLCLKASNGV